MTKVCAGLRCQQTYPGGEVRQQDCILQGIMTILGARDEGPGLHSMRFYTVSNLAYTACGAC